MTIRKEIIELADSLIRERGYNAFSFYDISKTIGIKTSSIHYHFPLKRDLGIAVIREHIEKLESIKKELSGKNPEERLDAFLQIFLQFNKENKICIVGSLATDFNTLDDAIKKELKIYSKKVHDWVTEVLVAGKKAKVFNYQAPAKTKALMIISNMMALIQLARLSKKIEPDVIKKTIINELTHKEPG